MQALPWNARRWMAAARLAVAVLWLAANFIAEVPSAWTAVIGPSLFAVFAAAVLATDWKPQPEIHLLPFLADMTFFTIAVGYGPDPGAWVSSIFYAYLLSSALLLHPWWHLWVLSGATALSLVVLQPVGREPLVRFAVWSLLVVWPAAICKRRAEHLIAKLRQELQESEERVRQIRDSERQKIAGDIHDGPLQSFIALQLRLEVLGRLMLRKPDQAAKELQEILALHKSQIAEIRAFLRGMRPLEIRPGGLAAALREVAAEFRKNSGIQVSFENPEPVEVSSVEVSTEIAQLLKEALNNVQKHSRATRVAITLKRAQNGVELCVEDNGQGFPFAGSFDLEELDRLRIGPASIQRRLKSLKGGLILDSRPHLGSRLRMRIPV